VKKIKIIKGYILSPNENKISKGIRGPEIASKMILYGLIGGGMFIVKNVLVDYSSFT